MKLKNPPHFLFILDNILNRLWHIGNEVFPLLWRPSFQNGLRAQFCGCSESVVTIVCDHGQ